MSLEQFAGQIKENSLTVFGMEFLSPEQVTTVTASSVPVSRDGGDGLVGGPIVKSGKVSLKSSKIKIPLKSSSDRSLGDKSLGDDEDVEEGEREEGGEERDVKEWGSREDEAVDRVVEGNSVTTGESSCKFLVSGRDSNGAKAKILSDKGSFRAFTSKHY